MNSAEKIDYQGWENCYRITNNAVELIITADVGPRLIHFGFKGEENEFFTVPEMMGQSGGRTWLVYGGHRFWHAPEHPVRTYFPDNTPVVIEDHGDFVRLVQETEVSTGIQKEMDIRLDAHQARLQVIHRLRNHNMWAVELAPWALSVMAPGGIGIVPLPPRKSHAESLLPANTLSMWAYTDMSDPRWTWGKTLIMLRQDPARTSPQKVGISSWEGWAAYANRGHLFVKFFDPQSSAHYPDLNSSVEFFTNEMMLEVETLGPLVNLLPGTAVTHTETWVLLRDIAQPENEADVLAGILPKIERLLAEKQNPS